jgi:anti-sigma-K factor RskA
MLEAYALGAVPPEEGAHIEEHLADCLACWEHLSESQRAAALLALAVPLEEPRESLRQRIIAQARRESEPSPEPSPRPWRLPRLLAVGATALVLAAVGALSWSLVHLHNDYNDIQQQATVNEQQVNLTRNIVGLLMRPDVERQAMVTSGIAAGATAYYMWTRDAKLGAIVCHSLPDPPEGKVYQLWLSYDQGPVSGGTFTAWQEQCQHVVSLAGGWPTAVNVSVEPEGGSPSPSSEIVLSASLSPH